MSQALRDRVVAAVGDRYLIEIELGRGASSVVYRATDLSLKRRVALKVLPPERAVDADVRERFRREAEMAARLTHPGIVPIHAVDERDGIAFVVMGYIDGPSLEERLSQQPRQPVAEVRRILGEVADALAYAHSRGIIHRDVTPANIMLEGPGGRPMLTDFGIARATSSDHSRLTAVGMAIGTPAYMAPEQAMGDREVDARADIYSLGVIGWQMLAGERPFEAPTALGLLMKQVAEPLPALGSRRSDAPSDLVMTLERALAKSADDRWETAGAFRDALRSALSPAPPPLPRPSPPSSRSQPPESRPARISDRASARTPVWPPGYVPQSKPRPSEPDESRSSPPVALSARDDHRARIEAEEDYRLWGRTTSLVERARAFRRAFLLTAGISSLVVFTPEVPPLVVLPIYTLVSSIGLRRRMRSLRADGLRIGDVLRGHFTRRTTVRAPGHQGTARDHGSYADAELAGLAGSGAKGRQRGAPALPAPPRAADSEVARLAPRDVLDGPYGQAIRDAADDRAAVREAVARLEASDRALLPEIEPTVTGLVDRVASLAVTLHRLDAGLSDGLRHEIAGRLEAVRAEPDSAERERRIALLQRQDEAVADLIARRTALAGRLDSAGMALRTLRLDLVRLRASGVGASIEDVSSATQEARALSRDIAVALEAARDLRAIG